MVVMLGPVRALPVDRTARILRWTFRRHEEVVSCELGLDRGDSMYELTVSPPETVGAATKETFTDAIKALNRQAAIERQLIRDGWSLDTFHTERVFR